MLVSTKLTAWRDSTQQGHIVFLLHLANEWEMNPTRKVVQTDTSLVSRSHEKSALWHLACYSGSMSILKFLGMNVDQRIPTVETETVRKIVQKLDQLPEEQARYIAAFAFLLSRAARADLQIDVDETTVMERIVMEQGGMPEELAVVVVQMAKTQNQLFGSTENYLVTREFERIATREQKLGLLDCLFAVTAADENITAEEDNVVKQIASELKLSHDDYIAARSRFREYLAVLKPGRHNE